MTDPEHLLARARRNPGSLHWRDFKSLLTYLGFKMAHIGGVHFVFQRGERRLAVVRPSRGRVERRYVERALDLVEEDR